MLAGGRAAGHAAITLPTSARACAITVLPRIRRLTRTLLSFWGTQAWSKLLPGKKTIVRVNCVFFRIRTLYNVRFKNHHA